MYKLVEFNHLLEIAFTLSALFYYVDLRRHITERADHYLAVNAIRLASVPPPTWPPLPLDRAAKRAQRQICDLWTDMRSGKYPNRARLYFELQPWRQRVSEFGGALWVWSARAGLRVNRAGLFFLSHIDTHIHSTVDNSILWRAAVRGFRHGPRIGTFCDSCYPYRELRVHSL